MDVDEHSVVGEDSSLVCVVRVCYMVFYTVWRFWRFRISSNLSGLNTVSKNESRLRHHLTAQ